MSEQHPYSTESYFIRQISILFNDNFDEFLSLKIIEELNKYMDNYLRIDLINKNKIYYDISLSSIKLHYTNFDNTYSIKFGMTIKEYFLYGVIKWGNTDNKFKLPGSVHNKKDTLVNIIFPTDQFNERIINNVKKRFRISDRSLNIKLEQYSKFLEESRMVIRFVEVIDFSKVIQKIENLIEEKNEEFINKKLIINRKIVSDSQYIKNYSIYIKNSAVGIRANFTFMGDEMFNEIINNIHSNNPIKEIIFI